MITIRFSSPKLFLAVLFIFSVGQYSNGQRKKRNVKEFTLNYPQQAYAPLQYRSIGPTEEVAQQLLLECLANPIYFILVPQVEVFGKQKTVGRPMKIFLMAFLEEVLDR